MKFPFMYLNLMKKKKIFTNHFTDEGKFGFEEFGLEIKESQQGTI